MVLNILLYRYRIGYRNWAFRKFITVLVPKIVVFKYRYRYREYILKYRFTTLALLLELNIVQMNNGSISVKCFDLIYSYDGVGFLS